MEFGRLMVAIATPFKDSLELDIEAAAALAKRLADEGVESFVVSGTTGESPTLSRSEKVDLVKAIKKATGLPVIANAG
ncbi:MAG: dihydrodipicolinate synthase family protein, partial [Spirochaetales bacterium]|nr:dihydrodipicolinate synthase family protein [Spirochaetales bacterium]